MSYQISADGWTTFNAHPGVGATSAGPSTWIVHPLVDIFFCCGGLVWALFAFHYFVVFPENSHLLTQLLAIVAIIATHAFSETHTVATLVRIYRTPETRDRYAAHAKWSALLFLALGITALAVQPVIPILAKIYLVWVIQHFTAQSYGMILLYCYKGGYHLSTFEKRSLAGLMNLTALMAIVRQFTYKEWNPDGFLAQRIPFWGPLPEGWFLLSVVLLIAAGLIVLANALKRAHAKREFMPLPAILMMLTGVGIFTCTREISGLLFAYVPALYHGSQYVVLTAYHHLKENGHVDGNAPAQLVKAFGQSHALKYFGLLMLGAITLYIGVPRLLQEFGFAYGAAFATVFLAVNLHHFLTDMSIWKLREPKLRKALI